jgi:hypothetical protein
MSNKGKPKKALAVFDDVFSEFKTEKLALQVDQNDPDLSANDAVLQLIKNSRELRNLKKNENTK